MATYAGGAFVPGADYGVTNQTSTGSVLTTPTITGASIYSGTVSGATWTAGSITTTGAVLTTPTITAPAIAGAATVASGATLTTPTVLCTTQNVIATGATGGAGAALSAVTPCFVYANSTGVSGAGLDIPTGAGVAGSMYIIVHAQTGALNLYAVGGTINGTTGTTAYPITATGNKYAVAFCTAAGTWKVGGNT